MMSFLNTELGGLIKHMDMMSSFVLIVLLGMSIACWTILLYKTIQLHRRSKENRALLKQLDSVDDVSQVQLRPLSSFGRFGSSLLAVLTRRIKGYQERSTTHSLSLQEWENLQAVADQLVEDAVHQMESGLSFLSTAAAVAPLLGLFGTVWGLVHAFIAIGKMHSTDISSVAPGIAQALITTLAGLLVAIPAVIMYNYLTTKIRSFEQELYSACNKCGLLVQHSLVR